MKYLFKNLIIAFLIFMAIAGFFTILGNSTKKPEKISLTQLVEEINAENISTITVSGNELEIESKDGSKKQATKEQETSLTESLKNYGVNSEKLKSVNLQVEKESKASFWLGVILPFLFPLLILGFFFWFTFRGAQRGQMKAFSFGRSKARLVNLKNKNYGSQKSFNHRKTRTLRTSWGKRGMERTT